MKSCILEPEYASCIYRVSFISFLSSIYAIYCECYDLAAVPGGVFLTSVNYWRNPVYGWRRNLDMSYVACALIYQNYRAYHLLMSSSSSSSSSSQIPGLLAYYTLMGIGMGCYWLSLHLYKKRTFGVQRMSIVWCICWRILRMYYYITASVSVLSVMAASASGWGTGSHQAGALRRFVHEAMRRFSGDI